MIIANIMGTSTTNVGMQKKGLEPFPLAKNSGISYNARAICLTQGDIMHRILFLLLGLPLLLTACDSGNKSAPAKPAPQLLTEALQPIVMELPSEALPVWRDALPQKGTLVLLSIHPFLQPIEVERADEVKGLVAAGKREDFWQRGSFYRANPALVPTETVSASLLGGLFKEIVWIFPASAGADQLSLDTFRKQLLEAKFLTDEEAGKLTLANGTFSGIVRGVPFRAAHPTALPKIDGHFALHIDLSYFRGLYQGEVKTPIYDVLHSTCLAIKAANWRPRVVTLSYSTIEGTISHDVRFLLSNLAELLRDPKLLEQMPASWAKRGEALYSVNFFLDQKVREMYQQNATDHPQDAAAQYDYYKSLFEQKKIDEALGQLDKAAALDPGYGAVYLELAQIAETDRNLPIAVDLLRKGGSFFADNPFIDFYRAQFLLQLGRIDQARPLIERLEKLPWSKRYHPQMAEGVKQMADYARNPQPPTTPKKG